jgi:hypothetical protein
MPPSETLQQYYITVPYAPLGIFQTLTFWRVLAHWAVPSLVLPAITGYLISFTGASARTSSGAYSLALNLLSLMRDTQMLSPGQTPTRA